MTVSKKKQGKTSPVGDASPQGYRIIRYKNPTGCRNMVGLKGYR